MKSFILAAVIAACMTGPAFAGSTKGRTQVNWGTQTGSSSSGLVDDHAKYGVVAGQVNDGAGLTGSPTYRIYTNTTCGVCTTINGNNVTVTTTQTGPVTSVQGIGNGGVNQVVTPSN